MAPDRYVVNHIMYHIGLDPTKAGFYR
uniref:Uncharacterized protein n=1 Tax=Anguilla anguilla TaxID=7936 RepID=A0A0E9SGA3_ANGAN